MMSATLRSWSGRSESSRSVAANTASSVSLVPPCARGRSLPRVAASGLTSPGALRPPPPLLLLDRATAASIAPSSASVEPLDHSLLDQADPALAGSALKLAEFVERAQRRPAPLPAHRAPEAGGTPGDPSLEWGALGELDPRRGEQAAGVASQLDAGHGHRVLGDSEAERHVAAVASEQ